MKKFCKESLCFLTLILILLMIISNIYIKGYSIGLTFNTTLISLGLFIASIIKFLFKIIKKNREKNIMYIIDIFVNLGVLLILFLLTISQVS